MDATRVGALLDDRKFDLRLTLVAGKKGLSRKISSSRIQKPGLVLAGFMEYRLPIWPDSWESYREGLFGALTVAVVPFLERQRTGKLKQFVSITD